MQRQSSVYRRTKSTELTETKVCTSRNWRRHRVHVTRQISSTSHKRSRLPTQVKYGHWHELLFTFQVFRVLSICATPPSSQYPYISVNAVWRKTLFLLEHFLELVQKTCQFTQHVKGNPHSRTARILKLIKSSTHHPHCMDINLWITNIAD